MDQIHFDFAMQIFKPFSFKCSKYNHTIYGSYGIGKKKFKKKKLIFPSAFPWNTSRISWFTPRFPIRLTGFFVVVPFVWMRLSVFSHRCITNLKVFFFFLFFFQTESLQWSIHVNRKWILIKQLMVGCVTKNVTYRKREENEKEEEEEKNMKRVHTAKVSTRTEPETWRSSYTIVMH